MFSKEESNEIRAQFPILSEPTPTSEPLIYLDSAATALKPQCVIDAVTSVLTSKTANIHRSVHFLGDVATEAYESTRETVSMFLGCESYEVVFLKNASEGLNFIANAYKNVGDIVSTMGEHHSNYLPWEDDTVIRLNVDEKGDISIEELEQILATKSVALVSVCHVSNVTGAEVDIKRVCDIAHTYGAKVMVDAAQSAPHCEIDVTELDCDFLIFSGHKLGAPTGVGVLYGKAHLLEEIDYWLKGGATIESITQGVIEPKNSPWRFEVGTPAIESVVGLDAALLYLMEIGMDQISSHQHDLAGIARKHLTDYLPQAHVLGDINRLSGPLSFYIPGISPHVLARGISDRYSICVRSGFHCAQPLHEALNAPASLRLSHWLYNTEGEVEKALRAIAALVDIVKK